MIAEMTPEQQFIAYSGASGQRVAREESTTIYCANYEEYVDACRRGIIKRKVM